MRRLDHSDSVNTLETDLCVQDNPELAGIPPPPLLHLRVRGPDVLVRVGHARHLPGDMTLLLSETKFIGRKFKLSRSYCLAYHHNVIQPNTIFIIRRIMCC